MKGSYSVRAAEEDVICRRGFCKVNGIFGQGPIRPPCCPAHASGLAAGKAEEDDDFLPSMARSAAFPLAPLPQTAEAAKARVPFSHPSLCLSHLFSSLFAQIALLGRKRA